MKKFDKELVRCKCNELRSPDDMCSDGTCVYCEFSDEVEDENMDDDEFDRVAQDMGERYGAEDLEFDLDSELFFEGED